MRKIGVDRRASPRLRAARPCTQALSPTNCSPSLRRETSRLKMLPAWVGTVSSVGMAVVPPLVYASQTVSIFRNKCVHLPSETPGGRLTTETAGTQPGSQGMFVMSCASFFIGTEGCEAERRCRLIANITRLFFWLGHHFEFALLMQSVFMILAQVRLILPFSSIEEVEALCLKFLARSPVHLPSLSSTNKP